MRTLTLATLFLAASASAQPTTKLVGFVTADAAQLDLTCATPTEQVAHLTLVSARATIEVPITCEAAPALAFATEVPSGRYRVSVVPDHPGVKVQPFVGAEQLDVRGRIKLVTLKAPPAPLAITIASRKQSRHLISPAQRPAVTYRR
jgi:hypothetical protein